jgi:hypothetical protein
MGGCSSTVDEDEREAIDISKKIDKENAKDYLRNAEKIKILLLGNNLSPYFISSLTPPLSLFSSSLQVRVIQERVQSSNK